MYYFTICFLLFVVWHYLRISWQKMKTIHSVEVARCLGIFIANDLFSLKVLKA